MTPGQLSEQLMLESAQYGTLTDQLIAILERKPAIWNELRKNQSSDTSTERVWSATADGLAETTLRLKLRSLEKSMSSIKTRLRVLEMEVRNLV